MNKYNKDLFLNSLTSIEPMTEDKADTLGRIFCILDAISNGDGFNNSMLDSISMDDINEASELVYDMEERISRQGTVDDESVTSSSNELHEFIKVGFCKGNINKIKMFRGTDILFF